MRFQYLIALLCGMLAIPGITESRTKLVALPDRAEMVVSMENPRHPLLYEEREIPLQEGTNYIDFSWNGVSIDANSVMIELLSHPGDGADATKIIATGFPPNEQALTWQLYSPEARMERIRVSYILRGLADRPSYDLRVNEHETQGDFQQYIYISNTSGEDLDGAVLRFRQMDDLSRSMDSGETRRFLAQSVDDIPVNKLYVSRPGYRTFKGDDGEDIGLVYEIENSEESGLGQAKLPGGKMRMFGRDGMGSSIFLGEDMLEPVVPGESEELTLGQVKDVVLKRHQMREDRVNRRYNDDRRLMLFDVERVLRYEIENFKNEPVTLRIHEEMNGDWEVRELTGDMESERKSINELVLTVDLPAAEQGQPAEKVEVNLEILIKNRFPNES